MAIVVNSDASAFKRTANLPSATAYSMFGWFMLTTDRNTFSGLLGITDGTNYHQLVTNVDGTTLGLYRGNPGANNDLLALSTNTWYFAAMTCAGTGAGQLIGYARALTSNALTSVSAAGITFTPNAVEWGRDGFTGEYMSGRIHACGMANRVMSADELLELSYYHEPQLDGIALLNVFYPCIADTAANCQVDKSGNARNATATPGALADSPPLLWRATYPSYVLPAATTGGAITGAIALDITPTGTLTGTGALAGSVGLTLTPSGALSGAGALAGAVALAITPTGTLLGLGALNGAVALSLAPTGTLTGAGALVGSVPLTFTPVGALTGTGALTGSVSVTFAVAGTLANADSGAIAGAVASLFTVNGTLSGAGALGGVIALNFGVSGALSDSAQPVVPTQTPTQTPAGRAKRRYLVHVDGQDFPVANEQQAVEVLQRARAVAERLVETKASNIERRLRKRDEVPEIALAVPVISVPFELREATAPLIADIERLYAKASVEMELRLLLLKQQEMDDDDDDVLLLI